MLDNLIGHACLKGGCCFQSSGTQTEASKLCLFAQIIFQASMCGARMSATRDHINAVVIPATAKHTATVFFLHGLGDSGHGVATFMKHIPIPHVKYVLPHAPRQEVTVNHGMHMPSWFDVKNRKWGVTGEEDESGIKSAAKTVHEWLDEEIKSGIASERIIVSGISQGGALGLYSTFTYDKPLAGYAGLSTWIPLHSHFPAEIKVNQEIPIFQAHGDADPLVPQAVGEFASKKIKDFNPNHSFKVYPGLIHWVNDKEVEDMKEFFIQRLPKID